MMWKNNSVDYTGQNAQHKAAWSCLVMVLFTSGDESPVAPLGFSWEMYNSGKFHISLNV